MGEVGVFLLVGVQVVGFVSCFDELGLSPVFWLRTSFHGSLALTRLLKPDHLVYLSFSLFFSFRGNTQYLFDICAIHLSYSFFA